MLVDLARSQCVPGTDAVGFDVDETTWDVPVWERLWVEIDPVSEPRDLRQMLDH
jgi:hypothetical protein